MNRQARDDLKAILIGAILASIVIIVFVISVVECSMACL